MRSLISWYPRIACGVVLGLFSAGLSAQSALPAPTAIQPDTRAIARYIELQMERNRIPGVAVAIVSNDSVVYAQGFGTDGVGAPVTERTSFVLGSMSKSVTALAVMQLVEQNLVQLDAPVQRYLPWFRVADSSASARITVRQLLLHTSGIPAGAPRATADSRTLGDHVRALARVSLHNAPGALHEYSSPNYLVLGAIVEAVSQRSFGSYVQESIFTPLGMRDSRADSSVAFDAKSAHREARGYVYAFGFPVARTLRTESDRLPTAALSSSAADMGRFLAAQLRTDSNAVLSAAGFARMHSGGAPSAGFSYAFGWRDGTLAGQRAVHHGGIVSNFRGKMVLLPERKLGVVVLTNVSSAVPWPIAPTSHVMADDIAASLVGVPLPSPSNKHRWLFALIGISVLLITLHQLRTLIALVRSRTNVREQLNPRLLVIVDVAFAAGVVFILPQLVGLSFNELLLGAPDVGWWLAVAATLSLLTAAARLVRGRGRRPKAAPENGLFRA